MQKLLYSAIHANINGANELIFTDETRIYLPTEKISVLHYHNRCEIGICKKGNGIWVRENKTYALSDGDIIVNPAGSPHYSRSIPTTDVPQCEVKFFYFDEKRLFEAAGITSELSLSDGTVTSPTIITRRHHSEVWFILSQMIQEMQNENNDDRFNLAAHWYAIYLLKLRRLSYESVQTDLSVNPVFLPAFRKIVTEFSEPMTVKQLADACALSPNYFNTGFRKAFGLTPMRYLNRFRVGIATELLTESSISITDISHFVGFTTPSEFYRNFFALYGMSPSRYRTFRNSDKS